jgi:hypothetical protein
MVRNVSSIWGNDNIGLGESVVVAQSMIAARNALTGPLPASILGDPALGILLRLFVANAEGSLLTIAGIEADKMLSRSNVARWCAVLEAERLVVRHDGEHTSIYGLTNYGLSQMQKAIEAVVQSQVGL